MNPKRMDTENCNHLHPHILTDRPEKKRLFGPHEQIVVLGNYCPGS